MLKPKAKTPKPGSFTARLGIQLMASQYPQMIHMDHPPTAAMSEKVGDDEASSSSSSSSRSSSSSSVASSTKKQSGNDPE